MAEAPTCILFLRDFSLLFMSESDGSKEVYTLGSIDLVELVPPIIYTKSLPHKKNLTIQN